MSGGWLVEIVVLAMIAGFVALRLVSVLGRRTGHEQPLAHPLDRAPADRLGDPLATPERRDQATILADSNIEARAVDGVRAIVAADPGFDVSRFLEGAQSAYAMVLDAFWKGDAATLETLVDDSVVAEFTTAIEERVANGVTLDNRLVRVDRAVITDASLNGMTAQVTVRFDADLVAVTRDAKGDIVAGSTSDAVATHDVWTFSRHVRASDPNWLLVTTDEDLA